MPLQLRVMRREPGFCATVIFLLGLGIATTCLQPGRTVAAASMGIALAAVALVGAAALLACLNPTRRTLRLPPALVLREE